MMGTVRGGTTALLDLLENQFGVDLARLIHAKTEAAALDAETKIGHT